ncbi:MAG: hypothetical protein QGF32_06415, partial [Candidatus Thalassarchaeaceae archaeon]|nr:hypothetical protein [Candidatus Thalassarchaeaceae archaeon]
GSTKVVNIPSGTDYLTMRSDSDAPDTTLRAITIADFTFIVNKSKIVEMTDDMDEPSTYEAMFFVRQGDYGTTYTINAGSSTGTFATPDGAEATDRTQIDTGYIAGQLSSGVGGTRYGSVVYVSQSTDFSASGSDGLGGQGLVVIKDTIQNVTDLPLEGKDGFRVKVAGQPADNRDDYWVVFVADNGSGGSGHWEETRGPNTSYKIDPSTMPHVLIRQADGEFRLAPCDGSTYEIDGTEYAVPEWADREVGDDRSNSLPSFVGLNINDLFLFKNRLGMLAEENVILSESAEFFNFWRTTVTDLKDTDPIDVASTNASVSILTSAIPFANVLVLFSNTTQFMLQSNGALSPKTVAMVKTTSFESVSDVRPVPIGNNIYFGFDRGEYTGVQQYFLAGDTEDIFQAQDIAAQVPQYIKGELRDMAGSSYENVLFCLTETDRSKLYFYKYADVANERLQSAWARFVFPNDTQILGIEFIDTSLYMISLRGDNLYLDKIRMETGLVDDNSTYRTRLDRRVDQSQCTLDELGTTLTLPYAATATGEIEVITKDGRRIPVLSQTPGSPDIILESSATGLEFWAGEIYTMTFTLSDTVMRDTNDTGAASLPADARAQVRYLTINYANTSYFRMEVTPDLGDTYKYPFTARTLGDGSNLIGKVPIESGAFRIPIYCKRDGATIQIINDTPLPCSIVNLEYELSINARSVRYN